MSALASDLQSTSLPDASDIRLLVLDIDGTISGESNTIRPAVLEAIRAVQAKGIQVAIATGRMYCAALRFYEAVGSTLPLLSYQGAYVKEPKTGVVHHHWPVARHTAEQLLDYFEDVERQADLNTPLSIHFYINDRLYVRDMTPETAAYAERSGVTPNVVGDLRQVLTDDPTKVLALSHDPLLIDQLLDSLRQRYTPAELYFTKSVATFFEAANPQVNKGVAVRYLAEQLLGLSAAQVMTIGDNFNDVEMLDYAQIGIAMGNAPEAVQAFADWTTADVEEDGVAIALEKFLL
ncbi:Cof-type HAD-IIB family hydrolase [Leptolyngbya sp. CCY15150]|uniref:Cof-type HAD-IIB family hydrolase n=1 Tax=Leptolyngbya sp. CCY15150 TaxID=2767772 RepID=UPI0019525FFE|nr:Cof-type HAD-IIB family hydrolase [Leptolyngbya sp. CCY15150]